MRVRFFRLILYEKPIPASGSSGMRQDSGLPNGVNSDIVWGIRADVRMKASNGLWRSRLIDRMPSHLATELDIFENELALKKQGKIEDRVFAETRLRRGSYGQRYDNGQRHDGRTTRILEYPTAATKGPHTLWDAPGMQRIKIPFGGLNATQLEVLAELAEEYSDGVAHVTTRAEACALVRLHDLGAIAVTREENGQMKRGFELYVGGGLGTVPQQAKLFAPFLPEEELLPMAQAIARVFARHGEKKNRNTARIKF